MNLLINPAVRFVLFVLFFVMLGAGTWVVSRFLVAPQVMQLSGDFEYSADLLSFDNFYNEETETFSGETRSVTTFAYRVTQEEDGIAAVQNVFEVRTVAGERIIRVEREYGIDKSTLTHRVGHGDRDRAGYLFAPRNSSLHNSFLYWHVNYDQGIIMRFDGEEIVEGVPARRYVADFVVDQTKDLGHLPGVPEERGVNLDVSLKVWIEPASGWLIKYSDSAIAYYYDIKTGQRLHPWNKFRNLYSKASVVKQAQIAQQKKAAILLVETGLPLLVVALGFFAVLWRSKKRKLALLLVAVGLLGFLGYMVFALRASTGSKPILIGISRWVPPGNSVYDENIQGFKDALEQAGFQEGREVEYVFGEASANEESQRRVAREFAQEDVRLVYSLTTPGTLILKEMIPNRPIVFSVVTYPVETGVVESLNNSGNNLVGTRNWIPIEEQLDIFRRFVPTTSRIGFVHRSNEPNSTIQLQEMIKAAQEVGIEVEEVAGDNLQDLVRALGAARGRVDSLYSACDTLVQGQAEETIIAFARQERIPSFSCNISGPEKGDLVGTVADFYTIGKLAGEKAALILEGAAPSSLQTDTVIRPFIYINASRARELGIQVPQDVAAKAQEIIE